MLPKKQFKKLINSEEKDFRGKSPPIFRNPYSITKPTASTKTTAPTVSTESTVPTESTTATVHCQMKERPLHNAPDHVDNQKETTKEIDKIDITDTENFSEEEEEEENITVYEPNELKEPYLAIIEQANETNGLYIVNVTIKNHCFRGLIDTGSQVSIIPTECAKYITDISTLPTRTIRTASGTLTVKRIPESIEMIIENYKISIQDLLISPNTFHGFEGILGLDVLKKINIHITFNNKSLNTDLIVNHVVINKNNLNTKNDSLDQIANKFKIAIRLRFPNLEPKNKYDVGRSINTAPIQKFVNVKPLNIKFYSCPITPDLLANIHEMEHYGIIRRSKALEIQPFYSIIKRDKNNQPKPFTDQNNTVHQRVRILFDARELNHKTVKLNYEPNTLAKIIQSLRKFTFAFVIDLHQGFFQIKLNPENCENFNFKVGTTTYSYARLPQGCINSPIIFQRSIELLFEEFRERSTKDNFQLEIYQDDIILLTSKDAIHHLRILEEMLSTLSEKDARLSVAKSKFLKKEIEYLSWKFSYDSIKPSDSSISKLVNSTLPVKKKNLYSIIQAANYFHTAIPNWEKITRPLYQLTRGNLNDKIEWNQQQHLYKNLLTALLKIPPLKMMDPSKPLILAVDASNEAVGGYLYQEEGNKRQILGHFCNVLGPTIKARSPSYLELKSIAVGVDKFKNLITGRTLYIHSDHKSLSTLLHSKSITQPKHFELMASINQYATAIKYLPGNENTLADLLSRPNTTSNISKCYAILETTSQERDTMTQIILQDQNNLKDFDIELKGMKFKKGGDGKLKLPLSRNKSILKLIEMYHEKYAHLSARKMEELIKNKYLIQNLRQHINKYLEKCEICQKIKDEDCLRPELKTIQYPEETWEIVASDILVIPQQGKVIQFICTLSRFWIPVLLENLTAENTINITIKEIFSRFGSPKKLIVDSGTNYKNADMKKLCDTFNIEISYCTPDHKTGNSIAERSFRTMRTILMKLKCITDKDATFDLKSAINYAAFIYNISKNDTTRKTPFQVMFGREPNNIDIIGMEIGISENVTLEKIKMLRMSARITSEILRQRQNQELNKSRGKDELRIGSKVFIKSHPANKLQPPFQGPYIVKKIIEDTCHLSIEGRPGRPLVRNKAQLKLFQDRKPTMEPGSRNLNGCPDNSISTMEE